MDADDDGDSTRAAPPAISIYHALAKLSHSIAVLGTTPSSTNVDIAATIATHIRTNTNLIAELQDEDDNNNNNDAATTQTLAQAVADIAGLQSTKEDVINAQNKVSTNHITLPSATTSDLTVKLSAMDANILNTQTQLVANRISSEAAIAAKHPAITAQAKLPHSLVAMEGSALAHVDIAAPLAAQLAAKHPAITAQAKLPHSLVAMEGSALAHVDIAAPLAAQLAAMHPAITAQAKLPHSLVAMEGSALAHVDIDAPLAAQLAAMHPAITAQAKLPHSLVAMEGSALAHVDITAPLAAQLAAKHPAITAQARLPHSLVAMEGSALAHVDIDAPLAAQLAAMHPAITAQAKLPHSLVAMEGSALAHVDITAPLAAQLAAKHPAITAQARLSHSLVDMAGSALAHVDIDAPLAAQLAALTNGAAASATSVAANATNIAQLQAADVTHAANFAQHATDIAAGHPLITSAAPLAAALVQLDSGEGETLPARLAALQAGIDARHPELSAQAKLPHALVDLGGSALAHVDITAPLAAQLQAHTDSISTLQGFDGGVTTSFAEINNTIAALQTLFYILQTAKEDTIGDLNKINTNFVQLPNLQTLTSKITEITDSISTLSAINSGDASSISSIIADLGAVETAVAALQTATTGLNTSHAALQTTLAAKHDQIGALNKLPADSVDLGGSALAHVDITAPLAAQLTGINNSIAALQTYDSSQSSLNASTAADIVTLQTGKHDGITADAKLNHALINLTGSALAHVDITAPLAAQLTAVNDSLAALQGTDAAHAALHTDAAVDITALQGTDAAHASDITALQGTDATHASNITALEAATVDISYDAANPGTKIAGWCHFPQNIPTCDLTPSADSQLTRKGYVDDQFANLLVTALQDQSHDGHGTTNFEDVTAGGAVLTEPLFQSSVSEMGNTANQYVFIGNFTHRSAAPVTHHISLTITRKLHTSAGTEPTVYETGAYVQIRLTDGVTIHHTFPNQSDLATLNNSTPGTHLRPDMNVTLPDHISTAAPQTFEIWAMAAYSPTPWPYSVPADINLYATIYNLIGNPSTVTHSMSAPTNSAAQGSYLMADQLVSNTLRTQDIAVTGSLTLPVQSYNSGANVTLSRANLVFLYRNGDSSNPITLNVPPGLPVGFFYELRKWRYPDVTITFPTTDKPVQADDYHYSGQSITMLSNQEYFKLILFDLADDGVRLWYVVGYT